MVLPQLHGCHIKVIGDWTVPSQSMFTLFGQKLRRNTRQDLPGVKTQFLGKGVNIDRLVYCTMLSHPIYLYLCFTILKGGIT